MTTAEDADRGRGTEVRLHGIGDHATYSALGKPRYREVIDSRVWIGEVPMLPPHKLRLVNWSRANRQLTRNIGWYLAFPATLVNVAGYMEPPKGRIRTVLRLAVGTASVCLTVVMAAWICAIIESGWQAIDGADDRLTRILLQFSGPAILITVILYRLANGRVLVDRGGILISLISIGSLVGVGIFAARRPASTTAGDGSPVLLVYDEVSNAIDPMTPIVVITSVIVCVIAIVLALLAFIPVFNARAPLAGAALLLVLAISILHAGASIVRLVIANVLQFFSWGDSRRDGEYPEILPTMLPVPDDVDLDDSTTELSNVLRIDFIPAFFLVAAVVFGVVAYAMAQRHQKAEQEKPEQAVRDDAGAKAAKDCAREARAHYMVTSIPKFLPWVALCAIPVTVACWAGLAVLLTALSPWCLRQVVLALNVLGAVLVIMILARRPERWADEIRRTFAAIADIAGFWSPDLHPLAGASYRRALLAGLRQAVTDLQFRYPDEVIALVGHSQGSVVCAWFVRGAHWEERRAEARSDRRALKDGLHAMDRTRSDRIALFTCGSPLESLYATCFPLHFGTEFFERTRKMTYNGNSWWNFWRLTDPIGTALPDVHNTRVGDKEGIEAKGHGEYWKEEAMRKKIAAFLEKRPIRTAGRGRACDSRPCPQVGNSVQTVLLASTSRNSQGKLNTTS
ncbi:hypothetical protein [Nocardia sp. NPDC057353]|uniref:hypothetical protein n=1 Tax=Nocardia sp. NPDC057353 TaxID=3346104 RepID=UPI00362C5914